MWNKVKSLLLGLVLAANANASIIVFEDFEGYTLNTWPASTWIEGYQVSGASCGAIFYDVRNGSPFGTGQAAQYVDGSNSWSHIYRFDLTMPADYEVSADMACGDCWITLRVQNDGNDGANSSYWIRSHTIADFVSITKANGGTKYGCPPGLPDPVVVPSGTSVGSAAVPGHVSPHNFRVRIQGDRIEVFINDVSYLVANDSNIANAGLGFGIGMINGGWIDNILVETFAPFPTQVQTNGKVTNLKAVTSPFKVTQ